MALFMNTMCPGGSFISVVLKLGKTLQGISYDHPQSIYLESIGFNMYKSNTFNKSFI